MTKTQSLDELFTEEEGVLARRARERAEAEAAFLLTPEGQTEAARTAEAREKRNAYFEALQAAAEAEPDDEDEDEDEEDEDEEDV